MLLINGFWYFFVILAPGVQKLYELLHKKSKADVKHVFVPSEYRVKSFNFYPL